LLKIKIATGLCEIATSSYFE